MIETFFGLRNSRRPIENTKFFLWLRKVSVQLENTIWIFGGTFFSKHRRHDYKQHLYAFFKFLLCIVLGFHLNCWRHYQRFDCIQYGHQNVERKSCCDHKTLLWFGTDVYGRKAVRIISIMSMIFFQLFRWCTGTHSFCRCVMEFKQIYEYPLFVFFAWNLLALSSTLVILQFQLVEYMIFVNFISPNL